MGSFANQPTRMTRLQRFRTRMSVLQFRCMLSAHLQCCGSRQRVVTETFNRYQRELFGSWEDSRNENHTCSNNTEEWNTI